MKALTKNKSKYIFSTVLLLILFLSFLTTCHVFSNSFDPNQASSSPWISIGPRSIMGSTLQSFPGNTGAGKVNSLSVSQNGLVIYAGSGVGPGTSGPYSDGGVRLSTNSGTHWTVVDNGLSDLYVTSVLMDPNDTSVALAGTWFSGIFRTSNSGGNWSMVYSYPANALTLVGSTVFAATQNGIVSSNDFGQTWQAIQPTSSPVRSIIASMNGKVLYAGLDNGQIMVSVNGGAAWHYTTYQFVSDTIWSLAINSTNPSTAYAVAWTGNSSSNDVWMTNDEGNHWALLHSVPSGMQYVATDPLDASILYVMGNLDSAKSVDGGKTFSPLYQLNVNVRQIIVDPQNDSILYVASDQGIYKSTNGGSNWSSLNGDMSSSLLTSVGVSNNGQTIIATAQASSPLFSFDGGKTWQVASSVYGIVGQAVLNQVPSYANIFTSNGLYSSTDGGKTFTKVSSLPTVLPGESHLGPMCNPNAISVDPQSSNYVYLATTGGIYASSNYGQSFSPLAEQGKVIWSVAADGNNIYASTAGGIFHSANKGLTWSASSQVMNVNTIAIDPSNSSIIFVGNGTGLYKSTNSGVNFTAVSDLNLGNVINPPCSGVSVTYFAIVSGLPTLFVGTGAGLFASTDQGAAWNNLTFNMNTTEVTSVDYANGNLYVSTYGDGILEWPSLQNYITSSTTTQSSSTSDVSTSSTISQTTSTRMITNTPTSTSSSGFTMSTTTAARSGFFGIPTMEFEAIIGAIVAIIAVTIVFVIRRRNRPTLDVS